MLRTLRLPFHLSKPLTRTFITSTKLSATPRDSNPAGVFHKDDFTAQDPYPLKNRTEPYAASSNNGPIPMSDDLTPHTPIDRSHETKETKRARLLWQSRKRGILETDLILSTFAATQLENMSMSELQLYDKLLDQPDWEIYYYATSKKPAPEEFRGSELMEKLIQHVKNEEKQTRSMPSLKDQSANYRADKATDSIRTKQSMMSSSKDTADPKGKDGTPKDGQKEGEEMDEKLKKEDRDPSVIAS